MTRYMVAIKKAVEDNDGEWRTTISTVQYVYTVPELEQVRRTLLHDALDGSIDHLEYLERGKEDDRIRKGKTAEDMG